MVKPIIVYSKIKNFTTNVTFESTFDIYSWADFECTYSTWYLWNPYWYFRACCEECDICDDSVYNIGEL